MNPRRDPITARAIERLAYVQRIAIERLMHAVQLGSASIEAAATACVELTELSTPAELREVSSALQACVLELTGVVTFLTAEGATLEVVAVVKEAMRHDASN